MIKRPLADENGNDIVPLDPTSDVAKLIYLLEWARVRRFQLGPNVQIGDIIVNVVDMDQATRAAGNPDTDIWEQAGHKE